MSRKLSLCLFLIVLACCSAFAKPIHSQLPNLQQQNLIDQINHSQQTPEASPVSALKQQITILSKQLERDVNNATLKARLNDLNAQLKSHYRFNLDAVCDVSPVSDNCANAILLSVPSRIVGSTLAANIPNAPACYVEGNQSGGVWYKVIGNGETFFASTCDECTNFDTRIRVYSCGCDNLTCITGDDDSDCSLSFGFSSVSWCTEVGREYLVLIDGFSTSSGTFGLSLRSSGGACDNPVHCPVLGRCCYFVNGDAQCSVMLSSECLTLGGDFVEGGSCATPCPAVGNCGPMDLVFVVDTTGSMGGAIGNVVAELPNIIALANAASSGDLRLGLVTFGDQVTTLQQLASGAAHIAAVQASISGLTAWGGDNTPEASDEALLEVITQNLPGSACTDGSEFVNAFRANATKIIVLVTDAPPAGCDDSFGAGVDDVQAHNVALFAAVAGIRISSVYVETTPFNSPLIVPIMQDYALTSSGSYRLANADGSGTAGAINSIIANCGQGSLQLSAVPVQVRCDNGVIVPNPLNITVNLLNDGTAPCDSLVVTLDDGSGPGGTGTVTPPASMYVGTLLPGTGTSPVFTVTLNPNPAGGLICFRAHVTSSTCPSNFYDICIDVPPCGDCVPDERVIIETVDPTGMPIPNPHACAHLHPGFSTQIVVQVTDPSQVPVIHITPGCYECGDSSCVPLLAWTLGTWIFHPAVSAFSITISPVPGVTGCCVCIHVDGFLPVELASLTATSGESSVTINWSTATETDNDHFEIMRNGVAAARVATLGNGSVGHSYSWTDNRVSYGTTYAYSLVAVTATGSRQDLGTVNATPSMNAATVSEYSLHQNYPNPFNPTTEIVYDMKDAGTVSIKVYNMMGQEVAVLVNGEVTAGRHNVTFNATNLPSGLYVYKMETESFSAMNKMLLIK